MKALLARNDYLHIVFLTTLTSFLISNKRISQTLSHKISNELFSAFVVNKRAQINIFVLVLLFFNDNLYLSSAAHYLLNKIDKEREMFVEKLQIAPRVKNKILDIFVKQIKKLKNLDQQLSKLELSLLLNILLIHPEALWSA